MGTLIVASVIVLVLVLFVGLVWLFVRIAPPPQPRLPEPTRPEKGQAKAESGRSKSGKNRSPRR